MKHASPICRPILVAVDGPFDGPRREAFRIVGAASLDEETAGKRRGVCPKCGCRFGCGRDLLGTCIAGPILTAEKGDFQGNDNDLPQREVQ